LKSALADALPTTTVELRNGDGVLMMSNTGWQNSPSNIFGLPVTKLQPSNPGDSALLATVVPGNFTVILKSPSGGTGTGLIEVYDVDR
jgi:hypothetical protein